MNTNRCVVCGKEIPEGMQVCKECYPCDECARNEVQHCWKHCARYKRLFCKVWQMVTERLKRDK